MAFGELLRGRAEPRPLIRCRRRAPDQVENYYWVTVMVIFCDITGGL